MPPFRFSRYKPVRRIIWVEHRAVLCGEGSGGVVVPEVQQTHDSAAAIGLILEHLAASRTRISDVVA
ncbi:MAG: hypothetical protein FJW26_15560 [Acidimicrobiia bacterium]|nr:hypothetical protein [Acidimicrobiia bacterium]